MVQPWSDRDYARRLMDHLPTGRVWPRGAGTVVGGAMAALGPSFGRVGRRAASLLVDAFPRTAIELLPEWEASLGLPDACSGPAPTIALRQRQVASKLVARGGQSVGYYTAVAAALGYTITIQQFAPRRMGQRMGGLLYGVPWAHAWQVTAPQTVVVHRRMGERMGERFATWGSTVLECTLSRIKPAHTILRLAYVGAPTGAPLGAFGLGRNYLT